MSLNIGKYKCTQTEYINSDINFAKEGPILSKTVKENDSRITMIASIIVECGIVLTNGNWIIRMIMINVTVNEKRGQTTGMTNIQNTVEAS